MTPLFRFIAAATTAAGVAHVVVAQHHGDVTVLTTAMAVDGFSLLAVGLWVALCRTRLAALTAGAGCAATVVAFVVAHTVGLPGTAHHHRPDMVGLATTGIEVAVVVAVSTLMSRAWIRRAVGLVAATAVAIPAVAVAAPGDGTAPQGCVAVTRRMTLFAEQLPAGPNGEIRLGYGTSPATASSPGPLIEMVEGECLAVTLVNHVSEATLRTLASDPRWPGDPSEPVGVSLHVHGVKYVKRSDGTRHTGSFVPPGAARTYVWYAAPRVTAGQRVVSMGTAGYWWYHDHVAGNTHGTGGLASGLFGGLIVRRPGDVRPDRPPYVVAMGGPRPMINFATEPDTFICDRDSNRQGPACFVAEKGERVEFLVIGLPGTAAKDDFHTFHVHGHNWADNRTGMLTSQADETRLIDAKIIGPSETFGFQVVAGEEVGPGDWMLHCHVQQHSDAGMVTFFRVLGRELGAPTVPAATSGAHAAHHHADGGHS
jgi:FtsP/CotA-like multicopper oxidase with cupredoxin domain